MKFISIDMSDLFLFLFLDLHHILLLYVSLRFSFTCKRSCLTVFDLKNRNRRISTFRTTSSGICRRFWDYLTGVFFGFPLYPCWCLRRFTHIHRSSRHGTLSLSLCLSVHKMSIWDVVGDRVGTRWIRILFQFPRVISYFTELRF